MQAETPMLRACIMSQDAKAVIILSRAEERRGGVLPRRRDMIMSGAEATTCCMVTYASGYDAFSSESCCFV